MKTFIYMAAVFAAFNICQVPAQGQTVSEKKISDNWKKNRKSDSLHKATKEPAKAKKSNQPVPKKIMKPAR
ncbi:MULTISPECIES: hypothetical protein [unclassified Mucilaginibacter]|uniref:hypothetical protein n=2 Tax=unclassified Mucilaginibacter TaxID=2617802 RepID=UPI002AC97ABB|nr:MULTISPECIES: hypothetical protein [unclassified Mucilaginibacter]MEB0277641.1 hypothetical protein [Mucilaginibacter sp. 10B2]WPX24731.1 hypothetical protein RHM67_05530 [Mucilaginibacter sp. 5C4]